MSYITTKRRIEAPLDKVFRTVADIKEYQKAVPGIERVEILSDKRTGKGTRFRETRMMNGREATSELEVTEFDENRHIRFVTDTNGTVWDSIFSFRGLGDDATELKLDMDAKTEKLMSRLFNKMIKGMVRKEIEKDLDAIKLFCESDHGAN